MNEYKIQYANYIDSLPEDQRRDELLRSGLKGTKRPAAKPIGGVSSRVFCLVYFSI